MGAFLSKTRDCMCSCPVIQGAEVAPAVRFEITIPTVATSRTFDVISDHDRKIMQMNHLLQKSQALRSIGSQHQTSPASEPRFYRVDSSFTMMAPVHVRLNSMR